MSRKIALLAVITLALVGCNDADREYRQLEPTSAERTKQDDAPDSELQQPVLKHPAGGMMGPNVFMAPQAPKAQGGNADGKPEQPAKEESKLPRKIVQTGHVDLVVKELDPAIASFQKMVEDHKGFISKSELRGTKGEKRSATWTIRIPVDQFQAMMDALPSLGETISVRTDSDDVSEEYYDLEKRIKNKRVEEQRLLDHMKKSGSKLEEILKVEEQLSRVREDIERMEGRMQRLNNLTSLTTIIVSMQEIKDYVPPTTPGFRTSISRTFGSSVDTLGAALRGLVLTLVALVPWSPFLLAAVGLPWWLIRRRVRRARAEPV
jgi:hypothetical protein